MKAAASLLALATIAVALPTAAAEAPRAAVRYADLDLTSDAGQAVLAGRIDRAAQSVCGLLDERAGSMLPSPHARDCYLRAKSTALQRVAEHVARAKARG